MWWVKVKTAVNSARAHVVWCYFKPKAVKPDVVLRSALREKKWETGGLYFDNSNILSNVHAHPAVLKFGNNVFTVHIHFLLALKNVSWKGKHYKGEIELSPLKCVHNYFYLLLLLSFTLQDCILALGHHPIVCFRCTDKFHVNLTIVNLCCQCIA